MATDYQNGVFGTALLALMFVSTTQAAPPPVEAFGRKPAIAALDINPAGTRLAWIESDGKNSHIVIHDIATNKALRNIRTPPDTRLRRVKWANDETILINESSIMTFNGDKKSTYEWARWIAVDTSGGDERFLLTNEGTRAYVSGATLLRAHTAKPGKVFMSTFDWMATRYSEGTGSHVTTGRKDDGFVYNAYEVDLKSGNGHLLGNGSQFTSDWVVDDTGDLLARSDFDPKHDKYSVLVKDDHAWRTIYDVTGCEELRLIGFSSDKKALLTQGRACGEDHNKIWSMPLDGSAMKPLFEDPTLEVDGVYTDPVDDSLLGVELGGPEQPSRWLDARTERRVAGLSKSFGARWVTISSHSANGQRVIAKVEDDTHPPIYYLIDYDTKKADIVNEAYPLLAGAKLGKVREFDYAARDKYPLVAYLTMPPDGGEKNLPLVVLPHGGPEARDDPGFDWLPQFLASRGYAVLQPQFRGSTGFGQAHADAGRHQWGLRMQDDITDGVKALYAQGIADPRRTCIVGWSYGGYAALAGAAFTPELYACAVSIAGVSDLPSMLGWDYKGSGGRESDSVAYWHEHIGTAGDPQVIAKSPARAADAIRAPILLIHGVEDTIVPIEQSQRMGRALKAAGKTYELIEIPGEDHSMLTSSVSRIRTLTELERFLGKYIGGATDTAPAAK